MWKNFFYYTKSERRVIILLLLALGMMVGFYWRTENSSTHPTVNVDTCFVDSFLSQLQRKERYVTSGKQNKEKGVSRELFVFDPNTADSLDLIRLGLKPFIICNILKYRAKGGVFRSPESFSKIYGLEQEEFLRLKPYLDVAAYAIDKHTLLEYGTNTEDSSSDKIEAIEVAKVSKFDLGVVVDLNRADTNVLKRVPGVGSGIAKMIVAYRERLGGFYKVEQLQDISYVKADLNVWFKVSVADSIRKLKINKASLDELRSHPYMNFYKAKEILEYRRKRGKIKDLPQLSMFEEFTEEDLSRLSPYLSFE